MCITLFLVVLWMSIRNWAKTFFSPKNHRGGGRAYMPPLGNRLYQSPCGIGLMNIRDLNHYKLFILWTTLKSNFIHLEIFVIMFFSFTSQIISLSSNQLSKVNSSRPGIKNMFLSVKVIIKRMLHLVCGW